MHTLTSSTDPSSAPNPTTSITERTFNRIDTALVSLAQTIDATEQLFGVALTPVPPSDKGVGGEVREVCQSEIHTALVGILDRIDRQAQRLAAINARSTL